MPRTAAAGLALASLAAAATALALEAADPTASRAETARGAPIVSVTPPEGLGDMARTGQRIFAATCAACHGPDAGGREGIGPPLIHPYYRPGHHGDAAFLRAVRYGVRAHHWRFGDMPPVPGLTDGDVKMIVAYIRAVQQANGIQ